MAVKMFDILDGEKLTAISAGLDDVPDLIFGDTETRAYLEAQRNHTLKQVYKKIDFYLKHSPPRGISFRRAIGLLAEELQKEANSE